MRSLSLLTAPSAVLLWLLSTGMFAAEPDAGAPDGGVSAKSDAPPPLSFKVKSGIVELRVRAEGEQLATVYWDDFGARKAVYSTSTVPTDGGAVSRQRVELFSGGWHSIFDPAKGTGEKRRQVGPVPGFATPNPAGLPPHVRKKYAFQSLPPRKVLGKDCEGYSMNVLGVAVSAWTWNGIPMYSETRPPGGKATITEVTSVKLGEKVPAEKFQVPPGVKLEER